MHRAIDELASAYHWSKADILETVYVDELPIYQKMITERQAANYLMLLTIAHNIYSEEPRTLFDTLLGDAGYEIGYIGADIDKGGLENLKSRLSGNKGNRA